MNKIWLPIVMMLAAVFVTSCGGSYGSEKVVDEPLATFVAWDTLSPEQIKAKADAMGFELAEYDSTSYESKHFTLSLNGLDNQPSVIKLLTIERDVEAQWEKELAAAGYNMISEQAPAGDFTWAKIYEMKNESGPHVVTIHALDNDTNSEYANFLLEVYMKPSAAKQNLNLTD